MTLTVKVLSIDRNFNAIIPRIARRVDRVSSGSAAERYHRSPLRVRFDLEPFSSAGLLFPVGHDAKFNEHGQIVLIDPVVQFWEPFEEGCVGLRSSYVQVRKRLVQTVFQQLLDDI